MRVPLTCEAARVILGILLLLGSSSFIKANLLPILGTDFLGAPGVPFFLVLDRMVKGRVFTKYPLMFPLALRFLFLSLLLYAFLLS